MTPMSAIQRVLGRDQADLMAVGYSILASPFQLAQLSRLFTYESLEALQDDLDTWLAYYNRERPHQGYRNRGKRPYETVTEYLEHRSSTEPVIVS